MADTVLEIVKDILNDISGDQINSIGDTEEANMIATFVKNAYIDLVSHTNWPHTRRAVALTPSGDSNYPTHMTLNDNVKELISINYDTRKLGDLNKNYQEMKYKSPDDFLRILNTRQSNDSHTKVVIDYSGIELLILDNKAPQYFTSIDDVRVIFDSYDSGVDTTLQESKTQAQAYIIPYFEISDDFVPDLPPDAFALLRSEVLSRAQYRLRQMADPKAEQEVSKQSRWLSRKSWRTGGGINYPNYGRKR